MAAVRWLCWGLNRAESWLLPLPARCPHRTLKKQVEGTEFQSIYSLDKLYPKSRGSDTAWRVPVSREGRTEGAFPGLLLGDVGQPGPHWPGVLLIQETDALKHGGRRGRRLVARATGGLGRLGGWRPPVWLEVCRRRESMLAMLLTRPPAFPHSFPVPQAQILVPREKCRPQRTIKAGSCQVAPFWSLLASDVVLSL